MPYSVSFEETTSTITIALSLEQKYHSPEAFLETVKEIISLKKAKANGKDIKRVIILVGEILLVENYKVKGKSNPYQAALEAGRKWLVSPEFKIGKKILEQAGITCDIALACKMILKNPSKESKDVFLKVDEQDDKLVNEEYAKYAGLSLENEDVFDEIFLQCKRFISDLFNRKVFDKQDKDQAYFSTKIAEAAFAFNTAVSRNLTSEEQLSFDATKGFQASVEYILNELVLFLLCAQAGFPELYYPFLKNNVASAVTDATNKLLEIAKQSKKVVQEKCPLFPFDAALKLRMINYWCKEQLISAPVKIPKTKNKNRDNTAKNNNSDQATSLDNNNSYMRPGRSNLSNSRHSSYPQEKIPYKLSTSRNRIWEETTKQQSGFTRDMLKELMTLYLESHDISSTMKTDLVKEILIRGLQLPSFNNSENVTEESEEISEDTIATSTL